MPPDGSNNCKGSETLNPNLVLTMHCLVLILRSRIFTVVVLNMVWYGITKMHIKLQTVKTLKEQCDLRLHCLLRTYVFLNLELSG